jgi:hypothetical protein
VRGEGEEEEKKKKRERKKPGEEACVRGEGEEEEEGKKKKKNPRAGCEGEVGFFCSFLFMYFLRCQLVNGGQKTHSFCTIHIIAALLLLSSI